jgi:hypothetical protein
MFEFDLAVQIYKILIQAQSLEDLKGKKRQKNLSKLAYGLAREFMAVEEKRNPKPVWTKPAKPSSTQEPKST